MTIAICVHAEDTPHYFGLSFVNSIVGVLLGLVAFGISTKYRDIVVPVNTPAGVVATLGLTQQCIARPLAGFLALQFGGEGDCLDKELIDGSFVSQFFVCEVKENLDVLTHDVCERAPRRRLFAAQPA